MPHSKDYVAGELSFHAKPAISTPLEKVRARGNKATEALYHLIFMWLDYGHMQLDELRERLNEYEKNLEVRKNGFKGKVSRQKN